MKRKGGVKSSFSFLFKTKIKSYKSGQKIKLDKVDFTIRKLTIFTKFLPKDVEN